MSKTSEILLAFRPKTLTAALVPCVAATALASSLQLPVSGSIFLCALMAAFLIQIGTNLVNDSVDFVKGADTAERIGPRRITASGILSPKQVMALGTLSFALAIAFGIPLVMAGGVPIVVIGVASVLMGYSYTAGPFPLAYLGLGDLFVILFFGVIAVCGLFFIHTGEWNLQALWLGLQIGFHATVLIAINNLRDARGDVLVGKKTLAVRFGKTFSRLEITVLAILPFLMNLFWIRNEFYWAAFLPMLAFPVVLLLARGIWRNEPGPIYNQFLGMAAGLHLLFGLLLSLGLFLR